jgi:hypothetical protein
VIAEAIERHDDPSARAQLAERVEAIAGRFPVPGLTR